MEFLWITVNQVNELLDVEFYHYFDNINVLMDVNLTEFNRVRRCKRSDKSILLYEQRLNRIRNYFEPRVGWTRAPGTIPIEQLNCENVVEFISEDSKTKDGSFKSSNSSESYRHALLYYYSSNKLDVPTMYEDDLHDFVKGRKRQIAEAKREGTYPLKEGKDELDFEAFTRISKSTALDGYFDGHLFFLLLWNMTCRADSVCHLVYNCIRWFGDCLRISLSKRC